MAELTGPFRFCRSCGQPGGDWLRDQEFRCGSCGFRYFQSVATACGVLIEHEGAVLFLVRAQEPSRGKLGLVGGFLDPGEDLERGLAREVKEEIGAEVTGLSFLGSFPNRYRFGGVTYHTCDVYFRGSLATPADQLITDPGEVTEVRWLSPSEVREEDLAFPSLRMLWTSLRGAGFSR